MARLRLAQFASANHAFRKQSYGVDSPNEMVVDADDYVGVADAPERDPVAIISPDHLDQADTGHQLQDLPLANDRASAPLPPAVIPAPSADLDATADEAIKELALPPLLDDPKILQDYAHTWTVENWRSLGKKAHGPVFHAGGFPWCVAPTSDTAPSARLC